jgi:hypothetical protein
MTSMANHAGLGAVRPTSHTTPQILESMKIISNMQVHEPKLRDW